MANLGVVGTGESPASHFIPAIPNRTFMFDPHVAIIYHRDKAPGAPSLGDFGADPGRYLADTNVSLSEALETEWPEDAHLVMYSVRDDQNNPVFMRVNKRGSSFVGDLIAQGGSIAITTLVFDHDLEKSDSGEKQVWSEEGLSEFMRFIAESDLPLPSYWYTTLHGSRFIYVLSRPVGHIEAEGLMRGMMRDALAEGLELDVACKDWTRLFRLPRVLRDGKRTELAPSFELCDFGQQLDPDSIEPADLRAEDKYTNVQNYNADQPSHEECQDIMVDISPKTGREIMSAWYKTAKQYLSGRDSYEYCFNNKLIDEGDVFEGRNFSGSNDAVTRIFGQMLGMLARQQGATAEGVYALMYDCIEQLDPTPKHPDWFATSWDIVCRMWANELAQLEVEQVEREEKLAEAGEVRTELVDLFRRELPGTVPDDDGEANAWLRNRMIASTGTKHHLMMQDGSYTVSAFGDSMLIPAIRDLGMDDVIEIHEMRGKIYADKSPRSILNGQAIPISRVICSSAERVAHVDGDPGYRTLTIPIHQLDPHLTPDFSPDVDKWLRMLFGEFYDQGVEWLSHSLDVGRAICALNLHGASGTGKGMLVDGLAECFRYKSKTSGNKVFQKHNDSLLESPIVHFDEGVPTGNLPGCNSTDQTFRALVTGGDIAVEGKGEKTLSAQVYPRIIFTSNNPDILRDIVGNKDLSDDDIKAIEIRLLSIHVSPSAMQFLTGKGNYKYTAGWVRGDAPSKHIIAQHILHLHDLRVPSKKGTGRLLVEGSTDTNVMQDMRMRTDAASAVVRTVSKMVEDPKGGPGFYQDSGRVWVLPYGIQRMYENRLQETMRTKLTPHAIGKVLRQIATVDESPTPKRLPGQSNEAKKERWWEVDLRILIHEAIKHGMPRSRMERYAAERHGADELANIHSLFNPKQLEQ